MACNIKRSKAQYSQGLSFFFFFVAMLYTAAVPTFSHTCADTHTHTESLGPFISGFIFDINLRRGVEKGVVVTMSLPVARGV